MSISTTANISNSIFAIIPFEEITYWNPRIVRSLQSSEDYEKLQTTAFVVGDYIEVHYVNIKNKDLYKTIEKYRFKEEDVNPYNKSFICLWNNTSEEILQMDDEEEQAIIMFNNLYMEKRFLQGITLIPRGVQIGYIRYLKSKMKIDFKEFVDTVLSTSNPKEINYNIMKLRMYVTEPEYFARAILSLV